MTTSWDLNNYFLLLVVLVIKSRISSNGIPYFFGYQTDFSPSKTIPYKMDLDLLFRKGKIHTVELQYIAEFRVHNPETAIWSERDMYEY